MGSGGGSILYRATVMLASAATLVGLAGCNKPAATAGSFAGYQVEWLSHNVPSVMQAGADETVSATFKNASQVTWPSRSATANSANVVVVSYHWFSGDGSQLITWEGKRTPLPKDVIPGETVTVDQITVASPREPGSYRLALTLLNELVGWFDQNGAPTQVVPVTVQ